jgi:hypothetical protein
MSYALQGVKGTDDDGDDDDKYVWCRIKRNQGRMLEPDNLRTPLLGT